MSSNNSPKQTDESLDKKLELYGVEADIDIARQHMDALLKKKQRLEKELDISLSSKASTSAPSCSNSEVNQIVRTALQEFQEEWHFRFQAIETQIEGIKQEMFCKSGSVENSLEVIQQELLKQKELIDNIKEDHVMVLEEVEEAKEKKTPSLDEILAELAKEDYGDPTDWKTREYTEGDIFFQTHWIILFGYVFDVSTFVQNHPGGRDLLLANCNVDSTGIFLSMKHSMQAIKQLKKLRIGRFVEKIHLHTSSEANYKNEKSTKIWRLFGK